MKKVGLYFVLILIMCIFSGCTAKKNEEGKNEEFTYKEVGLGDLKLNLEKSWEYQEEQGNDSSMAFSRGNSILGITCSSEATYQSGKDMAEHLKTIYSTFDGYKLIEDTTMIKAGGQTWYEIIISYKEDAGDEEENILYERCFGQDYNAYTLSLTSRASEYDAVIEEAKMAMDTARVDAPHNDETIAKETLKGQWNLGTGGFLVIHEDGTYQWYMDGIEKSRDNMHEGVYGCDDEVKAMSTGKGEGCYYLSIMPEHFYADGKESQTASPIYHFALSKAKGANDNVYDMVNLISMDIYSAEKLTGDADKEVHIKKEVD